MISTIFGSVLQGISASVIGIVIWGINTVIGYIAGLLFMIAGAIIDWVLNLNLGIINQQFVQIGWNITLSFANLGFTLVIIIIAFATIFRRESYAMKQTLGKLIVAALLVNFSLVIAGAFINVTTVFTKYLLDKANIGPGQMSVVLGDAFNVQQLMEVRKGPTERICERRVAEQGGSMMVPCNQSQADPSCQCREQLIREDPNEMKGAATQFGNAMLIGIASIFFAALFTVFAAITLLGLGIMLLIRFIALGMLLVLAPLAWLCWILPSTQSLWQKWWNAFLRWLIFAPVCMFFVFLTVISLKAMGGGTGFALTGQAEKAASQSLLFGAGMIGQMIMAIGLLIASLYTANSLGISFSGKAYKWAQNTGKMFGGWVGNKARRAATLPLRLKRVTEATDKLQKVGAKRGWFGKAMTYPVRKAGEFASRLAREPVGLIGEAAKSIEGLSPPEAALRWTTADTPTQIAILDKLRKSKDLDLLFDKKKGPGVPLENVSRALNQMERYRQRPADITEVVPMLDKNILSAFQNKHYSGTQEKPGAEQYLTKFLKGLAPSKWNAVQWSDIIQGKFKGDLTEEEWKTNAVPVIAKSVMNSASSQGISTMYRSLKQSERELIHPEILKQIIPNKPDATREEREKYLKENNPPLFTFLQSNLAQDLDFGLEAEQGSKTKSAGDAGVIKVYRS